MANSQSTIADRIAAAVNTGKEAVFFSDETTNSGTEYPFTPSGIVSGALDLLEVQTTVSNAIGLTDTPLSRFDDASEAVDFIAGLSAKRAITIDGTATITEPVEYDNSRNDTWHGPTGMSNLIEGGSRVNYTGTGKSATISAATEADPAVFTSAGHTLVNNDIAFVFGATGGTWDVTVDNGPWTVSNVSGNTFRLKDASGAYLSGVGLGTLTSATIRTPADMAGFHLTGCFAQSYSGLTLSTSSSPQAVVWIGGNDYFDNTDFSGSLTSFHGVQFRPGDDVGDANVVIENHKLADFSNCWFTPGTTNKKVMRVGTPRSKSRRTLLEGSAYNTIVEKSFIFGSIELQNSLGFNLFDSQLDANADPSRLYTATGGIASGIHVDTVLATNEGGATGTGLAAIHQGPVDQSGSNSLPYTGAWVVEAFNEFDWPIGIHLEAGMARLSANQLRGRIAGDVGIVIGENARGEVIDGSNDFTQMIRAGNIGIEDRRYKAVTITGATQANPVVLTFSGGHHFRDGDRIRVVSVGGMTQINDKEFLVAGKTSTTLQLNSLTDVGGTSAAVDGSAYGAYTSGGTASRPYMWHRESVGGQLLSLGHSDMVFDLALDQSSTLSAATVNVLNMVNVPIVGGHYEITYGSVVDMNSVAGTVKFDMSVGGVLYAQSSFERASAGTDEVHHFYQRRMFIPGIAGTAGSTLRFRCISPGAVTLRGKSATTIGLTFCQMRRVP